jgi:hypothetical protein
MTPPRSVPDATPALALPRDIWMLGCVSLLMDISSEMLHSLLPLFLVGALGAGMVVAARFVDRIGKGIRGAPRDALVADLVRPDPARSGARPSWCCAPSSWG